VSTDHKILGLLGTLSMRGWNVNHNGRFRPQLMDMDDKTSVVSHHSGGFAKQVRTLKPRGTLDLVCGGDHGEPEAQTDVI